MFSASVMVVAAVSAAPAGAVETPDAITAQLKEIVGSAALAGARAGVYVKRLSDRRELFALDPDSLLIPASNVKVVTSSAALHHFGPDFRFTTEVLILPQGGGSSVQSGDLVVKGYGDPSLVPERIWYLATRVYYAGVREVGDIIIDDTFFDGPRMANGWEQDHSDNAYMAPTGAVSVGFNAVLVHVLPGSVAGANAKVLLDPASDYAGAEVTATTVSHGRTYLNVDVVPSGDRSKVRVSGRIHLSDTGRSYWRRIDNPPVFAGEVLKAVLQQNGIKVRGKVRAGSVPAGAVRVTTVSSPRLSEIVATLNKNSNNFMAEQIALALGASRFGPPANWNKSQAAIESFLEQEVGIAPGTYRIGNGSGLHDVNRMSPRQMVAVLEYMHNNPQLSPEFATSLAVAGSSGTLAERMRTTDAAHLLRAKTGTLSNASALSGYVTTRTGDTLAFSIFVNDFHTPLSEVWHVQDQVGALLASLRLEAPEAVSPAMARQRRGDAVEVAVP